MVLTLKSVLITGSSRGIGLKLVKELTERAEIVFACCRSPENAHVLSFIIFSFVFFSSTLKIKNE